MMKKILLGIAIVAAVIGGVNLITATTPWIAGIAAFVAFGAFCFFMDSKEDTNSKKTRWCEFFLLKIYKIKNE